MARVALTQTMLKDLVKEALAPAGGAGSVKEALQSLVGNIGDKLKKQYPPEAVDAEMRELATQIEALVRSSVAKLKASAGEAKPS